MNIEPDAIFECSWEITNKCGGIYTVISSKAKIMQKIFKNYFAVGPLFDELPLDFTQEETPAQYQDTIYYLKSHGVRCIFGTWNIPGAPKTFLIDGRNLSFKTNEVKKIFWDNYGVDTLNASYDFNEPMIWCWAVGMFLENISLKFNPEKTIAHFHEWLAGMSLLYLKLNKSKIKTVFTTHATMLGRTICQNGENLYDVMDSINPIEKARHFNIMDKFSTELACANNADVFSTVSDITAKECTAFFKRKPEVLPNGLTLDEFPNFEEASFNHHIFKKEIKRLTKAYFFPYQTFDVDKTLFFYFGGRYEIRSKGIDVLSKALGKLNNFLKQSNSDKNVVMLFLVAMKTKGVKKEVLENKNNFYVFNKYLRNVSEKVSEDLINTMMSNKKPTILLTQEQMNDLKIHSIKLKRNGLPPLCSHILPYDENSDGLIKELRKNDLLNRPEDKVKVVMVPTYLDGSDGFFDMEYYDVVNGCHLGLFPSFYEPWGYTPLESLACGVPALTSHESGFGIFISDKLEQSHQGVFLSSWQKTDSDTSEIIFEHMRNFVSFDVHARVAFKMNAHKLAKYADWNNLIINYSNTYKKALNKTEQ